MYCAVALPVLGAFFCYVIVESIAEIVGDDECHIENTTNSFEHCVTNQHLRWS